MRRLPDFIVIGSMKSGTTTLYSYLSLHPRIFMSTPKEPRFFSLDANYRRGIESYAKLFARAQETQLAGEASTCYSRWPYHPGVVERLEEHVPNAKFIYLVRDPVERVYSHYRHRMEERVARGRAILPFREAALADPEILETGLYAKQLGRYLDRFDREQILCVVFEELTKDPVGCLAKLSDFLGIEEFPLQEAPIVSNESGTALARHRVTEGLKRMRRSFPVKQLADICPSSVRQGAFQRARELALQSPLQRVIRRRFQGLIPPYSASDREEMADYYRVPNQEFEVLIGKKLHWTS